VDAAGRKQYGVLLVDRALLRDRHACMPRPGCGRQGGLFLYFCCIPAAAELNCMHCPCPAPAAKQKRRHAHATRVHTGTGQTRAHARAALHCCRTPVGRPVWQLGVCMQQCTAVSGHQSAANGAFHFPIAGRDALPPSRARPRHTPLDPSPRTHSKIPGQSDTSAAYATHAFPNPWGKNMGDLTSPSSHTFACVRVVKCMSY
jgi:hypothetical protein